MTMISVDPFELTLAAETLRNCATESADIGSQLWACAQCAMPASLAGVVHDLVAAADRALDASSAHLQVCANDLANRAAIAANDPIGAATTAFGPVSGGVWGVIGGMNVVGGGGSPFGDGGGIFTGTGFSSYGTAANVSPFGDGGGIFTGTGFSSYGTAAHVNPFGDGRSIFTGTGFSALGTGVIGGSGVGGVTHPDGGGLGGLFGSGLFGGSSTTPFLSSSSSDGGSNKLPSFHEWSNDPRIDTDGDGTPNRWDQKFRSFDDD